ncbi:phosphate acetyltransferase [Candidatus Saccharibacteria bacterium]|nr:phosphate acetyltransferase [Candidatus Saccharibacteria bacterium]
MNRVRIVFPEMGDEAVSFAASKVADIEAMPADNLEEACAMVANGEAEGMVAGLNYTSRDVILAARDIIGVEGDTFSASFVMTRGRKTYVVGDVAACKNPTEGQLYDITMQTYETAKAVLDTEPKIAMLSFSTFGSGGSDPSIDKARGVISRVRTEWPDIQIDGEMQLDAAVNLKIAEKKAPGSQVAGRADVLIVPDLNTGNILYKAMEQFGAFTAAGPILQGFKAPCSDLSRGSTVTDIIAVIEVVKRQILLKRAGE